MKVSDDHSLFAWELQGNSSGLLAASPAAFSNSGDIIPVNPSSTFSGAITVNNEGIHLKLRVMNKTVIGDTKLAILPCTKKRKQVAMFMRAITKTGKYCERAQTTGLELLDLKYFRLSKYCEESICFRQERLRSKNQSPL